jgi:hypothetical protein
MDLMRSLTPLDYASAGTHRESWKPTGLAVVLLLALTGLACFVAFRIEILNSAAGGVLPKTEPGKWRFANNLEQFWRGEQAAKTGDRTLTTRPLTPTEARALQAEAASEDARYDLYRYLQTWALVQHLIVFGGLALAIWTIMSSVRPVVQRLLAYCCLALMLVAGTLMFYRSYLAGLMV